MSSSVRLGPVVVLALIGCTGDGPPPADRTSPLDGPGADRSPPRPDLALRDGHVDRRVDGPATSHCPPQMALVEGSWGPGGSAARCCIDRYEAALEELSPSGTWTPASPYLAVGKRQVRAVVAEGIEPQGYISGAEAAQACASAGKRLCTSAEWLAACRGPSSLIWPYGNTHVDGACNDAYPGHPVVKYFGTSVGVWDTAHMNDPGINQQPGTVAKGGAYSQCVSAWGVHDLHGNLHEWVDDAAGTFRGGFYADAKLNGQGCLYITTAHELSYHDYSTGFRCCVAAAP